MIWCDMCSVSDTSSVCTQSSVAQYIFSIGGCVCSTCSNDLTKIIFNTTTNTSHVTEVDS